MSFNKDGRSLSENLSEIYSSADISMDLTGCGLNVDKTEVLAKLYAEFLEWGKVKEAWHAQKKMVAAITPGERHNSRQIRRCASNCPEHSPDSRYHTYSTSRTAHTSIQDIQAKPYLLKGVPIPLKEIKHATEINRPSGHTRRHLDPTAHHPRQHAFVVSSARYQ